MPVDVLVLYQRSVTVATCNALHLYQSIRLSLVCYWCVFCWNLKPFFEKVANYACCIPLQCFQLFTFHSRSTGAAPPLLRRRGGPALCWSMLLATSPVVRNWGHPGLHRCFDFRVALIFRCWLPDFSEVCVCVPHCATRGSQSFQSHKVLRPHCFCV